jgi:predicted dithiol-disulfide oxidoreductase (DUF899 family)
MTKHKTGTREEWLAARLELLKAEKELTRRSDELARQRRELPWVRIDKQYRFETDEGSASLKDLFRGRPQLLVYHFMFGPEFTAGCPSCSAIADGFNGFAVHLANHDVMLCAVSRAPLAKLQAFKRRMGWTFPWASSFGGDFNYDFQVTFTKEQQQSVAVDHNFRAMDVRPLSKAGKTSPIAAGVSIQDMTDDMARGAVGTDAATYTREAPGMSAFALEDGAVYTRTRRTFAGWTRSGACTSGSTARHAGATRPRWCEDLETSEVASGCAATTSTTRAEGSRGCCGATAGPENLRRRDAANNT